MSLNKFIFIAAIVMGQYALSSPNCMDLFGKAENSLGFEIVDGRYFLNSSLGRQRFAPGTFFAKVISDDTVVTAVHHKGYDWITTYTDVILWRMGKSEFEQIDGVRLQGAKPEFIFVSDGATFVGAFKNTGGSIKVFAGSIAPIGGGFQDSWQPFKAPIQPGEIKKVTFSKDGTLTISVERDGEVQTVVKTYGQN